MSGLGTDDRGMEGNLGRPPSVLTWNISYEPLHPPGVLPWPERQDRIAEVTRDVDLIALQELYGGQLRHPATSPQLRSRVHHSRPSPACTSPPLEPAV
jgi:endonuclease/exonuclease/phosphatase family metal-dependent hydrolase